MDKSFKWRIQLAVVLTSLGVLYYLVFLFFLSAGIPIERIHYIMTDGWPGFCADYVPLVAPTFLAIGLGLGWSYNMKKRPKPVPEPAYEFQFKTVEKAPVLKTETEDFIFESRMAHITAQAATALQQQDEIE